MTSRLNWSTDGRDWPLRDASRFVPAGGIDWHIQELGGGPPLLLVHGTAASTHSWRGLAPLLARRYRVLSLDLPGHAFSGPLPDRQPMSIDAIAHAVGALLRELDLNPDLVVGHSAGAAILVRMCRDGMIAPRRGIVGLNGALLPFGGFPGRFFQPLAKMLAASSLVASVVNWRASNLSAVERVLAGTGSQLDPIGLELYARLFRSAPHVAAALGMMANWSLDTMVADIAALRQPLLLVAAGNDRAVPPETAFEIRERAPATTVSYVRNLGHLAHEERPDTIASTISDWLDRTGST